MLLHVSAPSVLRYDGSLFIFLCTGLVGQICVAVEAEWLMYGLGCGHGEIVWSIYCRKAEDFQFYLVFLPLHVTDL